MIDDIKLNGDEVIVEKATDIYDNNDNSGDLYLTNKNIVFSYEEGFLLTRKELLKISFNDIVIINDKLQLFYDDEDAGIVVRHKGGQTEFCFGDENEAKDFMQKIMDEVAKMKSVDREVELDNVFRCPKCTKKVNKDEKLCPECGENIEGKVLSDNQIKNLLKKGADAVENMSKENRLNKCKSCGASLSGNVGFLVKCEYCGNQQIIK